jgi:hypothetical protein
MKTLSMLYRGETRVSAYKKMGKELYLAWFSGREAMKQEQQPTLPPMMTCFSAIRDPRYEVSPMK